MTGEVTAAVTWGVPGMLASTQVAVAERVPEAVAVQPGTAMAWPFATPFTGAMAGQVAPVTVMAVTLAGAVPVLPTVKVSEKTWPTVTVGCDGATEVAVTTAAVCTVMGEVTAAVVRGVAGTFASTQVAVAERVPEAVAVQPGTAMACPFVTPFTGAMAGHVAPVTVMAVTLAGAVPVLPTVKVSEKTWPTVTVGCDGATEVAVTTAAVCTVMGEVTAAVVRVADGRPPRWRWRRGFPRRP